MLHTRLSTHLTATITSTTVIILLLSFLTAALVYIQFIFLSEGASTLVFYIQQDNGIISIGSCASYSYNLPCALLLDS